MKKMKIPARIGSKDIKIETDVVNTNIPLLLSKEAMKKTNTEINFKTGTAVMLGKQQDLLATSSGHYSIAIGKRSVLEHLEKDDGVQITLISKSTGMSNKKKVAQKLHSQFYHPTSDKMIRLVASPHEDTELKQQICKISEECTICQVRKCPNAKPVVRLPTTIEFNEVVAMDTKVIENKLVLHLIDQVTRFSAAAVGKSKKKEEIIQHLFTMWISIFSVPSELFSDNGGEFSNDDYMELCEAMNITITKTAAEAPFPNGLCE